MNTKGSMPLTMDVIVRDECTEMCKAAGSHLKDAVYNFLITESSISHTVDDIHPALP